MHVVINSLSLGNEEEEGVRIVRTRSEKLGHLFPGSGQLLVWLWSNRLSFQVSATGSPTPTCTSHLCDLAEMPCEFALAVATNVTHTLIVFEEQKWVLGRWIPQ